MTMLIRSVQLGIVRPFTNDSLQTRLGQEYFEQRINKNKILNKIILKSKVNYQVDKIIYQEILAVSIYSEKGKLICAFSYEELKANLLLDNSEAMLCLGESLKIPLVEVFENHYFKARFLRNVQSEGVRPGNVDKLD